MNMLSQYHEYAYQQKKKVKKNKHTDIGMQIAMLDWIANYKSVWVFQFIHSQWVRELSFDLTTATDANNQIH